ncbi:arsenical pump membrane protein [Acanthamoeba castellanii str. Neff]|uniref:Arsenical pump membrane protein n=1 Tax=Acanthamoeba castellanii (strain ATCC 30010 / Neff) TaxID=1257118 RepID=L8GPH6_ACACF|nr:arsenical pump membrane protein [Acanthamoeba castellanii str. Neff]ELR14905.1 arsenical pump membrane protein [Acanthamoeba castellanii str. Neff]
MGYGSFSTPAASRLVAPPPPFTPETFSLLESKRLELLREDADAESRHYEVNELLEREARQHSLLYRAFRGFFESRKYHKERKWFLSLPWNTIRIITISTLFFFALFVFVQQTSQGTHKVKLYFVAPGIYNTSFSHFPPQVHLLFFLQGKTPQADPTANGSATWDALDTFVHTITAPHGNEDTEQHTHTFSVSDETRDQYEALRLVVNTNTHQPIALQLQVLTLGWLGSHEVAIGILILVAVYVLIVFELVHRAIAALVGSFWALAFLSAVEQRPSFDDVVSWIDFETIVFLFGMMTLVGIFSETGFFEWSAIRAYKLSGGNIWHLVVMLVVFSGVTSSVLDNVTEVLLVVPVTLRLCKVIDVDPLPVVIAIVIFSNIGGTATGIGDPPNILIISNSHLQATELVDFNVFTYHMAPGAALAFVVTLLYFWKTYHHLFQRSYVDPVLKEIEIWKRTADKLELAATDEEKNVQTKLLEYIDVLEKHMEAKQQAKEEKQRLMHESRMAASSALMIEAEGECDGGDGGGGGGDEEGKLDIHALERKYRIRDVPLFIKSVSVIFGVVALFFIHPFVSSIHLNIPWIAILGALLLLTIIDAKELEPILAKVEMGTLFFFAGLFVLMRCLEEMGVMLFFARMTADIVSIFPEGRIRLCFAILLLMWVCALVSAFIDNIPFTTTMVPVVVELSQSGLGLPLQPLVWAVAFGVCLGGNGTLIGASANVVAAGIAEQSGTHISFAKFFAMGFPCMLISTATASVYLIITHVIFPWYSG